MNGKNLMNCLILISCGAIAFSMARFTSIQLVTDVQHGFILQDSLYGVYKDEESYYVFQSDREGGNQENQKITALFVEDYHCQVKNFTWREGLFLLEFTFTHLYRGDTYEETHQITFPPRNNQGLPVDLGEIEPIEKNTSMTFTSPRGMVLIHGVGGTAILFACFFALKWFYMEFLSKVITIFQILVMLLLGSTVFFFMVFPLVEDIYLSRMENMEAGKLHLALGNYDYVGEIDSMKQGLQEVLSREPMIIGNQDKPLLVEGRMTRGAYAQWIRVHDSGYTIEGEEEPSYFYEEELETMNHVVEMDVLTVVTHENKYHKDSFTIYVPLHTPEEEVFALYRVTYFHEMLQSQQVREGVLEGIDTILYLFITVTVLIAAFFLIPIIVMNHSIEKRQVYYGKFFGVSEIGRLKETMTDMSGWIEKELENIQVLKEAYGYFMPEDLLRLFGKEDITKISVGDQVRVNTQVLLIRTENFLQVQENTEHNESFTYLSQVFFLVDSIVRLYGGFIAQFENGNMLAVFPQHVGTTVPAGNAILKELRQEDFSLGANKVAYSLFATNANVDLGVIGVEEKKDIFMISTDLERGKTLTQLSERYHTGLLMDGRTISLLSKEERAPMRYIGIWEEMEIYEDYSSLGAEQERLRQWTADSFSKGITLRDEGAYEAARDCFIQVLRKNSGDLLAYHYFGECTQNLQEKVRG